jgi:hypothetical protein
MIFESPLMPKKKFNNHLLNFNNKKLAFQQMTLVNKAVSSKTSLFLPNTLQKFRVTVNA